VIPWIIFAVVVVPLVVVAFAVTRRKTQAGEARVPQSAEEQARLEREFADAEAYEAQWHEADKERFHGERLP
jgi:uncharacterized membrane protein YdfJ with MMPL/SSD domain